MRNEDLPKINKILSMMHVAVGVYKASGILITPSAIALLDLFEVSATNLARIINEDDPGCRSRTQ